MPSLLSTLWLPSQMEKQTIYEVMGLNEIEDPVTDLNVFVPFQQVRVRLKKYTSKAQAKCCYFVQINHMFTVISSCTDAFVFFVHLRCNNSFLRLVRFVYCLPRMKFCFRIQEAVAVVELLEFISMSRKTAFVSARFLCFSKGSNSSSLHFVFWFTKETDEIGRAHV